MKKYTLLLVLVLCLSQLAFAGPKFGIGGNLGFPMGDFADLADNVAFGGTAQALLPVGENLAVGAQAGYLIFGGKTFEESVPGVGSAKLEYDINGIPIQAIGRYYLGLPGGPRPFIGAAVGVHSISVDAKVSANIPGYSFTASGSETKTGFSFAPTVGIEVGGLDLSVFYQITGVKIQTADATTGETKESTISYVGARIGFNFGAI